MVARRIRGRWPKRTAGRTRLSSRPAREACRMRGHRAIMGAGLRGDRGDRRVASRGCDTKQGRCAGRPGRAAGWCWACCRSPLFRVRRTCQDLAPLRLTRRRVPEGVRSGHSRCAPCTARRCVMRRDATRRDATPRHATPRHATPRRTAPHRTAPHRTAPRLDSTSLASLHRACCHVRCPVVGGVTYTEVMCEGASKASNALSAAQTSKVSDLFAFAAHDVFQAPGHGASGGRTAPSPRRSKPCDRARHRGEGASHGVPRPGAAGLLWFRTVRSQWKSRLRVTSPCSIGV